MLHIFHDDVAATEWRRRKEEEKKVPLRFELGVAGVIIITSQSCLTNRDAVKLVNLIEKLACLRLLVSVILSVIVLISRGVTRSIATCYPCLWRNLCIKFWLSTKSWLSIYTATDRDFSWFIRYQSTWIDLELYIFKTKLSDFPLFITCKAPS